MALMQNLERVLAVIDRFVGWFVGAMLLSMTIDLFANSIGRAAFNVSFVGGPALGRLLMIYLTFFASYLLVRSGGHIAIDITMRMTPVRVWRWLQVLISLAGGATMAYITWLGYQFTVIRFALGQIDPMLNIPTGVFYLALPVSGALMALSFLHNAIKALADNPSEAGKQES